MKNSSDHICPSCLSNDMSVFHQMQNVPVHSVLNIPTREEALTFPRGNISLGFCKHCGFISNVDFNPELLKYSSDCEETQGYSPTFNAFAKEIATDLVEKYDLYNKDIIEIGCGKGEFLTMLCESGKNRGVGFDPAYVEGRDRVPTAGQIKFIKDYYSEKYENCQGDLICCRMTLEHIKDTGNLVGIVRRSIGERTDTIVFFQVPDMTRILRDCAIEDIYYEHCSYFSPGSLSRLFRQSGFDVLDLKTGYEGQYIMIEAKPTSGDVIISLPLEDDLKMLQDLVKNFPISSQTKVASWNKRLREFKKKHHKVVLWGSGSKGVSFLTTLGISDQIEYVVDINPYRQGNYMAATGQLIVAPDFLKEYQPDAVIIMNAIYKDEISQDLQKMGLTPEILTLE